jgi:general secretion pathway protein N
VSRSKRFIAVGVATFVAGIVLMFPARTAYTWFAPPELRLSGIAGTVWNGTATEGHFSGIYVHGLTWKFSPLPIFRGRLIYSIEAGTAFGSVSCDAGVSVTGDVLIQDLDSTFSLQQFREHFQLQGFDGTLHVRLESLVLRDGIPTEAKGSIQLANLMARQLSPDVIGDFQADFSTDEDGIVGSVEELAGVLDVAGIIRIGSDRNYSFIGKVAALTNAPRGLTDQLRMLGSADDRGQREFRIEGQL